MSPFVGVPTVIVRVVGVLRFSSVSVFGLGMFVIWMVAHRLVLRPFVIILSELRYSARLLEIGVE
jgi:hypothetical protein